MTSTLPQYYCYDNALPGTELTKSSYRIYPANTIRPGTALVLLRIRVQEFIPGTAIILLGRGTRTIPCIGLGPP